jgi:hypothetical protein
MEQYGAYDACDWICRRAASPDSEQLNIDSISVYIIIVFVSKF